MGASGTGEPIRQRQDVFGHGRKAPDLFLKLAGLIEADEASDDQLFMDIEPTTTAMENLHPFPPEIPSQLQAASWTSFARDLSLRASRLGATDGGCLKTSPIRFVAGS